MGTSKLGICIGWTTGYCGSVSSSNYFAPLRSQPTYYLIVGCMFLLRQRRKNQGISGTSEQASSATKDEEQSTTNKMTGVRQVVSSGCFSLYREDGCTVTDDYEACIVSTP